MECIINFVFYMQIFKLVIVSTALILVCVTCWSVVTLIEIVSDDVNGC